jgi:hypothetical protein
MKRVLPFVLLLIIGLAGCKQKDVGPDIASILSGSYQVWDIILSSDGHNWPTEQRGFQVDRLSHDRIKLKIGYIGTTGNVVFFEDELKLVQQKSLGGDENIAMTGKYTTGNANPGNQYNKVRYWFYTETNKDGFSLKVSAKGY